MAMCRIAVYGGVLMRTDVLGVGFDNISMDEAIEKAMTAIEGDAPQIVVTPNPEIVWMCREDGELNDIVNNSYLVLPDGIGVIYGARILGTPLKGRVPGIDFATTLFSKLKDTDKSVFLFGAKPGVAEMAAENLKKQFPGLTIAGTTDGYFKDDAVPLAAINNASPDVLLVCLGCPKQEKWMARNKDKLNVKLMAGLGGSLDVFAGTVKRAPEAFQKLGLEWFYRLCKEPKRIGRMMKLPAFIFAAMGQRVRGK